MSQAEQTSILAVGAHPDDVEFGCGGILLREAGAGARIQMLVCSKGESGSNGDAETREAESRRAAELLGAELRFLDLGGDGMIERTKSNALALAREIRRCRPRILLAPSLVEDQHPDHVAVGSLAREAARLARYGGLEALAEQTPWAVDALFFYAITPGAEPRVGTPLVVGVGDAVDGWIRIMECHASQLKTRNYVELQVARARSLGLQANFEYAQALWSSDPLALDRLGDAPRGARNF